MTRVDVVTVWAPRPEHVQWREDYVDLIRLQRRTCSVFGHKHIVLSDAPPSILDAFAADGSEIVPATLPSSVMRATIAGTIAYLGIAGRERHVVFLDADCIVARDLRHAFEQIAGLGLTHRDDPIAPVNNGSIYVNRDAVERSRWFFNRALAECGEHWGADQEAISKVAGPVPTADCEEMRGDLPVSFLSMRTHGVVPKQKGARHYSDPFVVHFKGDTKEWAQAYADRYVLNRERA